MKTHMTTDHIFIINECKMNIEERWINYLNGNIKSTKIWLKEDASKLDILDFIEILAGYQDKNYDSALDKVKELLQ